MELEKKYPKVITISGKMGAGKDTLATYIKEELEKVGSRVLITHYADLLKYILKTYLGWDGKKDERGRYLLQHVGTDIFRQQYDENFWCIFVGVIIYTLNEEWDCVLIPDARFKNEIESMKTWYGATSIQIVRPAIPDDLSEHTEHISEHDLDDYEFDLVCENDEGLEKLRRIAREVAGRVMLEKVRG